MKYRNLLFRCQVPSYIKTFSREMNVGMSTSVLLRSYTDAAPELRNHWIVTHKRFIKVVVKDLIWARNFSEYNDANFNRLREQFYFNMLWELDSSLTTLLLCDGITEAQASAYDFFFKRLYNHWFADTKPTKPATKQVSLSLTHPRHRRLSREQQGRSQAISKGKSEVRATLANGAKARHMFAQAKGKDDGVWDTHPLNPSQSGLPVFLNSNPLAKIDLRTPVFRVWNVNASRFEPLALNNLPLFRRIQVQHDDNHSPALA